MVRAFISERRWQRGKTGPSHEYTIGGWVPRLRDHQRFIAVAYPFCLTGNVCEPRRWRVRNQIQMALSLVEQSRIACIAKARGQLSALFGYR